MEPISAYALAAAISLGALAALHVLAWRARRERWYIGYSVAYTAGALIYVLDRYTQAVGDTPNLPATVLALVTVALLILGMVDYVGLGGRAASAVRAASLLSALAFGAAVMAGAVHRLLSFTLFSAYFVVIAVLALWAARREPKSGHGLVFLASLLYPAVVLYCWGGGVPLIWLRYVVVVPIVVTGMTMLTTSLVRAQRRADTELQRATEAEAALRELNESLERRVAERTAELRDMVAGLEGFNRHVSHDLRGPLGGIAGAARMAEQALQRGDTGLPLRVLPAIAQQAESAVQLLAALLQLARVSDAALNPQRLALESLVKETLEQLHAAQPECASVPVMIHAPLPEVEADPTLLRQVYANLVGNAVKFAGGASQPKVEVGTVRHGGEAVFYVRDNGVGFDQAKAAQLFEPFHRLHGASFPGHGVGLSIVKRIVQRHGGRVWADAAPGQGATFFFTLGNPR